MVEIAGSIAGIVSTVLGVGKCFMYLFNHKSNLRNLETEVRKLNGASERVDSKVAAARNNAEKIEETVEQWVTEVDSIVRDAKTLIEERANVRCFNLKTRYKQSKKASKKVKDVAGLLQLQEAFGDQVSRRIIHEDTRLILNKDYLAFQSRSSTLEDVLKALNEGEVDIIGVHGMGGIGKTTLVKEVGRQAKDGKRFDKDGKGFDKVIFVEVTDKPNIKEIREEIANNLGLKFDDKETETERVNKLFARLKQEKKILIILDNIWVHLDLEKLGIPKGCKLLLTARDRNVLDMMDSKSISIDVLNEDEAWSLFRKMTGEVVDMHELQSLSNDVCKECRGLPIAIVTVARALKSKTESSQWNKALQELRCPSPIEFKGVLKEAYSKIALSYNYLEGEELKKVFLLCSIMEYDASISNLFKFVMGLNILEGIKLTIEEARIRLDALLCKLKESCLLLDCSSERFSMHDVVRDIAITISYKDHHVLTERNDGEDEWENVDKLKKCTKIFLSSSDIISKHWVEGLECPKLEFFYMDTKDSSFKFPEKFFSGMTKLKVLSLKFLPPSISLPTGLRTLCLDWSKIEDVSIIGELKKLKILSLRGCYNIKQLPKEISQLVELRLLDLSKCVNLRVITPDVISKLVRLEELYMRGCSVIWAVGGTNVKRSNASLEEFSHMSCLTALEIDIKDEKNLPQGFFSKKLERYHISVGDCSSSLGGQYLHCDSSIFGIRRSMHIESSEFIQHKGSRTIKMKLNSSISLEELQGIKNVEFLCLDKLQNVKNGLQELDSDGFSQLKHLHVHNNPKLLCVVDSTKCATAFPLLESLILFNMINLEKICNGQPTTESFCNLKFIEVIDCDELTILLSFSTAKSLPQLQRLRVEDCKNVKEIFAIEREDNVNNDSDKFEFFQLRFLTLKHLPRLASFCSGMTTTSTSQSRHDELITLFDEKLVFPNLEALKLEDISEMIWCSHLPTFMTSSYRNLTSLTVLACRKLKYIFPASIVQSFMHLQRLEICECRDLKEIVANGAEATPKFVFSRVTFLKLDSLPKLTTFYFGRHTSEWPLLEELQVRDCKKVKIFTSECGSSNENNTEAQFDISEPALFLFEKTNPNLKELTVDSMITLGILPRFDNLEQLELDRSSDEVLFSSKEDCKLDPVLPFQNLTHLTVTHCGGILMNLITSSVARSLLQLREMTICFCDMIIEVVEDERDAAKDEIDFPKLKSLSLNFLENLVCFYSGNCILKFPSLEELEVNKCPNMTTFSQGALSTPKLQKLKKTNYFGEEYWEGDLNSTIQQIYKREFSYNHKALTLIGKDIKQLCRGQVPDDVKTLTIVKDKSTSIPVEILETFHNLEDLKLKASSYKELFSCGNDGKRYGTFTQLKSLQVLYCYNLTTLVPSPTSFENLTTLEVRYCNGLRSLMTSSTAKSLVQLREMTIKQCEMLTEVVAIGRDVEKDVVFRKLQSLSLDCLENLTCFCSGNYTFKLLSLNRLIVHNCPKMETFSKGVLSTPKLQQVVRYQYDLHGCWNCDLNTTIKQLQKMVVFPDMKYSELTSLQGSAEKLWDIQLPMLSMSTSSSYRNITCLILEYFHKLKYVFPSSLVKNFEQLQQLEIISCSVLKEIVTMEEVETTSTFVFPRVTALKLKSLPQLTSFYPGKHTSEWPVLRTLEVSNCEKVKTFTSEQLSFQEDSEEAHSLLLVEKINPNLEALRLSEIDSMMTWQGPFSENFFCKLKRLEIIFNKSTNVPVGILQRFKNLEMLKLHGIQSNEIFISREDEKTIGMPTHIKGLELDNCYNLEHLWKQDSKVPFVLQNLEVLEVSGCRKLLNVGPSAAAFQNLKVLTVSGCCDMVNLITSSAAKCLVQLTDMKIQGCYELIEIVENDIDGAEDEIIFSKLKWLSLDNLRSLTCFCTGKYTFKFPTLKELIVNHCPNMKTFCEGVLSTPRLQKVWEDKCLNIGSCSEGKLNTIIQQLHRNVRYSDPKALTLIEKEIKQLCQGQIPDEPGFDDVKILTITKDKSTSIPVEILETFHNLEDLKLKASSYKQLFSCGNDDKCVGTFSHLKILEVLHCHNLTTLVPSPTSFENLTTLEVRYCNGLRSLLTSSTAKSLMQLREMTIKQCEMLTEVVAIGRDVEKDVVFRKLESLSLDCLENLTCFYSENYTFKLLSLNRLIVHNCPKMETFSKGVLSTPKLQKVERYEYDRHGCWNCDLNTTIKQLQKMVLYPDMKYSELRSLQGSAENLSDIQLPMLSMSTSSSYRNITCLILEDFHKLKYVFPSSLVKNFEQLQQLEIISCSVLKEIVTMEEVETTSTFVFPRITALKLKSLPQLTSFYPGKHTSEWPVLRTLEVSNCEKVKTFTSERSSFHEDNEEAHSLLLVEKINPNLEELRVTEIDSVMTWEGPFSENFFCKLKRLEIIFNKSASVPVGILQRFENLEMLKLCKIESIEIFLCEEDEKTIGMPTHIKSLELDQCDELLEYLWKQDSNVVSTLQNLEVLEVYWCRKVINVGPSVAAFQNLKVLTASYCWGMVNLITSSAAKCLVQLIEMKILGCNNMIEIVESDRDGAEDEIIFTKLKWLSLTNLSSLTCFCTGKYTFKFPALEEVIVANCTKMKTFCEGVLSTPRLQKVWEDKCLNIGSCSEGELNTIIQQLHKNAVDKRKNKQIFQLN